MADPLFTEDQVAAMLRVNPRTLRRWRLAGKVSHERTPGGRIRYRWDDVIELTGTMRVEREPCPQMSG